MRTRCVCWGVIALVVLSGRSMAQTPAGPPSPSSPPSDGVEMSIIVPEVEVRSGPTPQYYPTAKMHQGERVRVMKECKDQPGWSAIKPPPGSFSWIREKFVKKVDERSGFVQAPDNAAVPVMPGSSVVERALNVESAKVPSGCAVVILDKPFHWEGENWLPIQATPGELRYIPSTAVRLPAPPVAIASGFPTTVGGDLITRADQAYRAGNIDQAKQLYRQAADSLPEPKKSYALNRLASLSTNGTAPVSTSQSHWQPIGQTASPPLANPPAAPVSAQTSSNYTVSGATMTAVQPSKWSGWGYLRRAGFEKDGQAVYVLENEKKQVVVFAVEQPGNSQVLPKMIGRLVCLYGPITYRADDFPRIQYMVPVRIAATP